MTRSHAVPDTSAMARDQAGVVVEIALSAMAAFILFANITIARNWDRLPQETWRTFRNAVFPPTVLAATLMGIVSTCFFFRLLSIGANRFWPLRLALLLAWFVALVMLGGMG